MRVPPLGREGPLEEGAAAHSSVLAWRLARTEEPGGLRSLGWQSQAGLELASAHTQPFAGALLGLLFFLSWSRFSPAVVPPVDSYDAFSLCPGCFQRSRVCRARRHLGVLSSQLLVAMATGRDTFEGKGGGRGPSPDVSSCRNLENDAAGRGREADPASQPPSASHPPPARPRVWVSK